MRVLRGFPIEGIVACFTEAPGGGDIEDINSPCNAPAKSPLLHLDRIAFHSDFYQYELAMPIQTVAVTHAAVPVATHVMRGLEFYPGYGTPISFTIYGQQTAGSNVLVNHDLGYTPLVMVAWSGRMVVSGTIVQFAGISSRRFVSVFANNSQVGINWSGYSDTAAMPAITVTYQVMVFRTPAQNPALPLFSGDATGFQLGRGKVNSDSQYLRKRAAAESWFDFDLGRTVDLNNGGARVITGGNVQSDTNYGGSFSGFPSVPVGP